MSHPLGDLGVTYALVEKPTVDLLFVLIELCLPSLMVEKLHAEIYRSRRFSKGVGTFSANFRRHPPTNVGVRKLE